MAENNITENKDNSLLTYYKRTIYNYDSGIDMSRYNNLVDFNFGEKFLYGRVNFTFVPMYLEKNSTARLVSVSDVQTESDQQVINFVADAFADLQNAFKKSASKGMLSSEHPYLSDLKVYKSHVSAIDLFNEHQASYATAIENHFTRKNIKVKNFMEFIEHLKPLLMKSVKEHPFTFSGFLKSMYCPINASGLVIEIADLDYFNDSQKMEFFYNSDHWEFYLNAAAQFGFMVDKNIPWRLVADIGSNEMLQYARRYRLNTTGRILNIGYSRPDFLYFQKLRAFLHKIYEMVRPANITLVEKCNGELVKRTIVPEQYSDSELKILFDDKKLLTLMFEIRIQEEPKSLMQLKLKKLCVIVFQCAMSKVRQKLALFLKELSIIHLTIEAH